MKVLSLFDGISCGDVLPLLNGNCCFETMDGEEHNINGAWDMIIAHPPCTRLCNSGQRWLYYGNDEYKEKKRKRVSSFS